VIVRARSAARIVAVIISVAAAAGCRSEPPLALAIVGESTRLRLEESWPRTTAWFDGERVTLVAARGETLGLQILHRTESPVTLVFADAEIAVHGFSVTSFAVERPSTAMYGGSRGAGRYPDALVPTASPATSPAYFEIVVPASLAPGVLRGELVVGTRRVPVELTVALTVLPPLPRTGVWAYGDPRELAWRVDPTGDPPRARPSAAELACIDLFAAHGVLLTPDLHLAWWPERRALLAGVRDLPVWIPRDPDGAAEAVRGWIEATRGTEHLPFTIPVDEPRTPALRHAVRTLASAVRAAGGGPDVFRYALTDEPRAEYGELVDLYIPVYPRMGDRLPRWTYNGAPPHAGSMVLDAETPGTRTWGWIAWRWDIPVWYVWDALYWHDRHNRHGAPLPGKPLEPHVDPISFDDGEDQGNFDGVLALPGAYGCTKTLRLAAVRRGQQDKQLLELAARCDPEGTARLAEQMVPRALGDAPRGSARSWSADESVWERARRILVDKASCEAAPIATR
jgi:hypothetical protein